LTDFASLGLAEPILRAVSAEGYTSPTPIQAQVIPAMLAGGDVLGTAQTGTGKTAAFVLPLLDRLSRERARAQPKTCGALILSPTRELANQIADNIASYGRFLNLRVAVILGGVKPGPQVKALRAGADIVVATPGRLLDHMRSGAVVLSSTRTLILDEADQMLDLGFIPSVRRIVAKAPSDRQTVMMSATMPKPIRRLAEEFQTDPTEIAIGAVSRPIETIAQTVVHTPAAAKREVLTDLLSAADVSRAIVFTRTKRGADRVHKHLSAAGLSTIAIHGNKSQAQRERALYGFRTGRTNILVATDIAARGIDVDDVSHVVNFELPEVAEAYVHRIGRTARAGRSGVAISLCDPAEAGLLRGIEKLTGLRIERAGPDGSRMAAAPDDAPPRRERAPARSRRKEAAPRRNEKRPDAPRGRKPERAPVPASDTPLAIEEGGNAAGTVKWFNGRKGFGFIAPDAGGRDVFVHMTAVERAGMSGLREGDRVAFSLQVDKPGGKLAAVNLQTT